MSWDKINRIGWTIERLLAWAVLFALLVAGLMSLLRAEWALVPAAARTQIMCSELLLERANEAPLAFADPDLASPDAALQHDIEECEHAPPPAIVPPVPDLSPFD